MLSFILLYIILVFIFAANAYVSNGGPGNVLSDEVFSLIRIHMGSRNKFSLVAQAAILGKFFNLHKCKVAASRYANIYYTRTTCANVNKCNTSFKSSFGMESRFNINFLFQGHGYALKVNKIQMWRQDWH